MSYEYTPLVTQPRVDLCFVDTPWHDGHILAALEAGDSVQHPPMRLDALPLGDLGDPLQQAFDIAGSAGNRAQDFGAGCLAIPRGAQLSLQPGVLPPEIGCHVVGKRGHSLKSILPHA